jgi:hypothetical protein
MSLAGIGLLLSLFLPAACVAQLEPVGCRSYEPAVVGLHGTLIRETFAGPPNYSDIRNGDKAETYWLLKLDSPICVNQDVSEPDLNPSYKDIHRVQLVLDQAAYERYKALLGKRVVATGSLFGAHTGHHHTPVLLTVTYLDQPRWK